MEPTQKEINAFNRIFWREFNNSTGGRTLRDLRMQIKMCCLLELHWVEDEFESIKDAAITQVERNTSE